MSICSWVTSGTKKLFKIFNFFVFYLKKVDLLQPRYPLKINELKEAFFFLHINKALVMMKSVSILSGIVLDLWVNLCYIFLDYL